MSSIQIKSKKRPQNIRKKFEEDVDLFPEDINEKDSVLNNQLVQNISKKQKSLENMEFSTKSSKKSDLELSFKSERIHNVSDMGATRVDEVEGSLEDRQREKEVRQNIPAVRRAGPMKAASNYRMTTTIDFKPGICKDYYETGFCGFGDNCIYAHIREEYKSSYDIDQEYDKSQVITNKKKKKNELDDGEIKENNNNNGNSGRDSLPFACYLCRKPFIDPVSTKCKHYFCEKCAISNFQGGKNPKCPICNSLIDGVFKSAKELFSKINPS